MHGVNDATVLRVWCSNVGVYLESKSDINTVLRVWCSNVGVYSESKSDIAFLIKSKNVFGCRKHQINLSTGT